MSSKKEPYPMHPGLLPMPGSATSLGVSWNPPANQAQAGKRLEEMQRRLSAPAVPMDMDFARDIVTDTWVVTMPDGTRRHITREEMENTFASNLDNNVGQQRPKPWNSYDRLRMRLGLEQGDQFGCHVNIYTGANSVYVFVASDDKALILEDPVSLFPSDSLIGQFRLWQESLK